MTAIEFQSSFSGELAQFLLTPCGKELVTILHGLRPAYETSPSEHVFIENRGAVRGYELCLRNILGLANPPKIVNAPEANYGVPDKETKE